MPKKREAETVTNLLKKIESDLMNKECIKNGVEGCSGGCKGLDTWCVAILGKQSG